MIFDFNNIFIQNKNSKSLFCSASSFSIFLFSNLFIALEVKLLAIQANCLQLKEQQCLIVLSFLNYLAINQSIHLMGLFQIFELYQVLYLLTYCQQRYFLFQPFVSLLEIIHIAIFHPQSLSYLTLILFFPYLFAVYFNLFNFVFVSSILAS